MESVGRTLSVSTPTIAYTPGEPTAWLDASLTGTTTVTTLRLQASSGALPAGTYTATVTVSSPTPNTDPGRVRVTLRVSQPAVVSSIAEIAAGGRHTCARTSAGAAWCWGSNRFGELGNNSPADQSLTPVPVRFP